MWITVLLFTKIYSQKLLFFFYFTSLIFFFPTQSTLSINKVWMSHIKYFGHNLISVWAQWIDKWEETPNVEKKKSLQDLALCVFLYVFFFLFFCRIFWYHFQLCFSPRTHSNKITFLLTWKTSQNYGKENLY